MSGQERRTCRVHTQHERLVEPVIANESDQGSVCLRLVFSLGLSWELTFERSPGENDIAKR